jgi:cytoskeletal protein CcmA (bactofilin family)/rare lipoprotein A (peptidoglycan hydrolase)
MSEPIPRVHRRSRPKVACVRAAVLVAAASAAAILALTDAGTAKTPGQTHCYGGVCHRVRTLDETRSLVGITREIVATHYDHPSVDRFNVGLYTSSGERFDAGDAGRASSSDLPDGTEVVVSNPATGRAAHLRINDFGPFRSNRTLDVTRAAAEVLGFAKGGVTRLLITVVWVPPSDMPRYAKGRRYPVTYGELGVLDEAALAGRIAHLIATGPARNGDMPMFAAPAIASSPAAETIEEMLGAAPALTLATEPPAIEAARLAEVDIAAAAWSIDLAGAPVVAAPAVRPVRPAATIAARPASRPHTSIAPLWTDMLGLFLITSLGMALLSLGATRRRPGSARLVSPRAAAAPPRRIAEPVGTPARMFDTVIAAGATFAGDLRSNRAVRVDGHVRGSIAAPLVLVAGTGAVDGAIAADILTIEGRVTGAIYARMLGLESHAVVIADVATDEIRMAAGCCFDGTVMRLPPEATPTQSEDGPAAERAAA